MLYSQKIVEYRYAYLSKYQGIGYIYNVEIALPHYGISTPRDIAFWHCSRSHEASTRPAVTLGITLRMTRSAHRRVMTSSRIANVCASICTINLAIHSRLHLGSTDRLPLCAASHTECLGEKDPWSFGRWDSIMIVLLREYKDSSRVKYFSNVSNFE